MKKPSLHRPRILCDLGHLVNMACTWKADKIEKSCGTRNVILLMPSMIRNIHVAVDGGKRDLNEVRAM